MRKKTMAAVAVALGLLVSAASTGPVSASGARSVQVPTENVSAGPGFSVENFMHPGADTINPREQITLKDGNGSLLWVPCNSGPGLLEIHHKFMVGSTSTVAPACFKATETPAWLKLEIKDSFAVLAGEDDVVVTSHLNDHVERLDVESTCYAGIQGGSPSPTVVEIRVNYDGTTRPRPGNPCQVPAVVLP